MSRSTGVRPAALVQVQPAEVDPDLRRRMYELGARADDTESVEAGRPTVERNPAAAALAAVVMMVVAAFL